MNYAGQKHGVQNSFALCFGIIQVTLICYCKNTSQLAYCEDVPHGGLPLPGCSDSWCGHVPC